MGQTQPEIKFRRILAGLNAGRQVLTTLGMRTYRVYVTQRTWQGGRVGAPGGFIDQAIYQGKVTAQQSGVGFGQLPLVGMEIVPRPKCRFISTREVASAGGLYHEGDLRVTYIQPFWTDAQSGTQHGYTVTDIAPDVAPTTDGVEIIYRVTSDTGSVNSDYSRIGTVTERFAHYELVLRSRLTTPEKF